MGQLHETNSVIFGLGISSSASGVPEDLMLSVPYGAQISGAFTSGTDVNEAKDLFSEYSKVVDFFLCFCLVSLPSKHVA